MTQVNLLPTEVREGQKSRRALAAVILAVGAAVFLLLFIYTLQTARLSNANHKLAAQQALKPRQLGAAAGQQHAADPGPRHL